MAEFFTHDGVSSVVGGPARILMIERANRSAYPLLISSFISKTTYQPAAGWFDPGLTLDPVQQTFGFTTNEWNTQQLGVIQRQVGTWNRRITTRFAEDSQRVRQVAHEGTLISGLETNADSDNLLWYYNKPAVTEYTMVTLFLNEDDGKLRATVYPRVRRSGSDSQTAWDRDNPRGHSIEWDALPDDEVPQNAAAYDIYEN